MHEVRFRGGCFARARDAGFGVGDDAAVEVDPARVDERLKRQDDRGGVAAGIRDESGVANLVAMQLGHAVDGLGLHGRGDGGAFIREFVDGAVVGIGRDAMRR